MTSGPAPPLDPADVPSGADAVLIRVGAIGTKSESVRRNMQGTLGENLRALLADRGIDAAVEHRRNRPVLTFEDAEPDPATVAAATDAATDAPGVVSASPAATVEPTHTVVVDALARVAAADFAGDTFAVRASRVGTDYPFDSSDLERDGGAAVAKALADRDPTVDLDDPDYTVRTEVHPDRALVSDDTRPGPGGLPLGTQRPLVALLSGGIDSPVAAFEVMSRGAPVIPVYVDLGEFGGADHRARAEASARRLASYGPNHLDELRVVDGGPVCRELADAMDTGRMLVFRRFLYRVAAEIAASEGATGVVTGEAIGQKSSQTTQNLSVLDSATEFPVHRPLLTDDKPTITERARRLGTYESAEISAGCNRFAPNQPETGAGRAEMADLVPDWLRERAATAGEAAERVDLSGSGY